VYTTLWASQKDTTLFSVSPYKSSYFAGECSLVPPAILALGYLFGFTLARLQYLSFNGVFCNPNASGGTGAAPGECYYYLQVPFKIGGSVMYLPTALILTGRKA
jgi:hypothetical protein